MEHSITVIKKEIYTLCWFMRGGISLNEMYALSQKDRDILNDIVKSNLEITAKTGLAYF
jgi:hypothetical protein